MGSIKKKLTKTLRKITPKEIAPILPFVAMAIPGMQGIGMAMRYALPQLLTAAASARQSGDINLMNQALALAGSYAAGPGGSAATDAQKAFAAKAPQTEMINASRSARGASSLGQISNPTLAATNPAAFAANNAKDYSAFLTNNPNIERSFMDSFRENILQPANEGLNNQFSKKGLMTIGGAGATMATSDYAKEKENEMEQENAERMGFIGDYYDATEAMKDYFVNQEYTLEDVYGKGNVPSFLLANGGRVNKNMGGIMNAGSIPQTMSIPQGMQLDGRGGGFIPMGAQEKQDDVPAMLAKNEFVMTSDAVRAAGGGSVEKGAQKMYDLMNQLEAQA
jgi:hypothetical protein